MYKSDYKGYVEEVNSLINYLDICGADAIEIINIYFECYRDAWTWSDFLDKEIRIIKDTEENQPLIAELDTIDDACLFEGDDYYMLTNYDSLIRDGHITDCLPKSF